MQADPRLQGVLELKVELGLHAVLPFMEIIVLQGGFELQYNLRLQVDVGMQSDIGLDAIL